MASSTQVSGWSAQVRKKTPISWFQLLDFCENFDESLKIMAHLGGEAEEEAVAQWALIDCTLRVIPVYESGVLKDKRMDKIRQLEQMQMEEKKSCQDVLFISAAAEIARIAARDISYAAGLKASSIWASRAAWDAERAYQIQKLKERLATVGNQASQVSQQAEILLNHLRALLNLEENIDRQKTTTDTDNVEKVKNDIKIFH